MTDRHRLQVIAPDLHEQLKVSGVSILRRVARAMAELAVIHTNLEDPRIDRAMSSLREGRESDWSEERKPIQALTDELDELQWSALDRFDAGAATEEEYLKTFRRARASATVWFALSNDPLEAAAESTYEANAAIGDIETVRRAVAAIS